MLPLYSLYLPQTCTTFFTVLWPKRGAASREQTSDRIMIQLDWYHLPMTKENH